jgi:predicted transcriptional regulator
MHVTRILEAAPQKLWPKIRKLAGVTKAEFDDYFAGAQKAIAIFIERVSSFARPVNLEHLRSIIPNFHPHQSFIYLHSSNPQTAALLRHLAKLPSLGDA